MEKLIGSWTAVSATIDGKPLPEDTARQLRLVLTKTDYTTSRGDEVLFQSTYTVNPNASPKMIDVIGTEGESAGKPAQGIYELDGDRLRLCYTMPGNDRPKAFESKAGSGAFFIVWQRAK